MYDLVVAGRIVRSAGRISDLATAMIALDGADHHVEEDGFALSVEDVNAVLDDEEHEQATFDMELLNAILRAS